MGKSVLTITSSVPERDRIWKGSSKHKWLGSVLSKLSWYGHPISTLDQGVFPDILKNTLPQSWCYPTLQPDLTQSQHGKIRNEYSVILKIFFEIIVIEMLNRLFKSSVVLIWLQKGLWLTTVTESCIVSLCFSLCSDDTM